MFSFSEGPIATGRITALAKSFSSRSSAIRLSSNWPHLAAFSQWLNYTVPDKPEDQ
jgi:hypothetical protein